MRVTIRGKHWKLRFCRMQARGECDAPRIRNKEIRNVIGLSQKVNDDQPGGDMTLHSDPQSADLNNFIAWLLCRMAAHDHGCLTGDCHHERQRDCVDSLRDAYYEDCDGEY
jgi:hypothetical protein